MTMEFTTEYLMNKSHKVFAVERPGGLAHLIAQKLMEEHSPKDQISKLEAKWKFMDVKLNPSKNLKKTYEIICKIENECNDNTRSLEKETLIAISTNATTTVHTSSITT